jgi:hypothetical protein
MVTEFYVEYFVMMIYNKRMGIRDIRKLVNANDNFFFSWLRVKDWPERQLYAKHIPVASDLIASKHCTKWWKNHPESVEYQYALHGICCLLAYPCAVENQPCGFCRFSLNAIRLR